MSERRLPWLVLLLAWSLSACDAQDAADALVLERDAQSSDTAALDGVAAGDLLRFDGAAETTPDSRDVYPTDGIDTDTGDTDPDCHWDCFGGAVCDAGVLYLLPTGPLPCSEIDPALSDPCRLGAAEIPCPSGECDGALCQSDAAHLADLRPAGGATTAGSVSLLSGAEGGLMLSDDSGSPVLSVPGDVYDWQAQGAVPETTTLRTYTFQGEEVSLVLGGSPVDVAAAVVTMGILDADGRRYATASGAFQGSLVDGRSVTIVWECPDDFLPTYGQSSVTITTAVTAPASGNEASRLGLSRPGSSDGVDSVPLPGRCGPGGPRAQVRLVHREGWNEWPARL